MAVRTGNWSTRRLARMALLVALCAVGSFIKIPAITGTPALDAAPGYFAALAFGAGEGALVAGIGHLLSALTVGFPLGAIHLFIAVGMAGCAAAVAGLFRIAGPWAGFAGGVLLNGFAFPALFIVIPGFGPGFFAAMLTPLFVASAINVGLGWLAWLAMSRAGLVRTWTGLLAPSPRRREPEARAELEPGGRPEVGYEAEAQPGGEVQAEPGGKGESDEKTH